MSDIINQTVLITDAKVIYYIGTAIRANGDLLLNFLPLRLSCKESSTFLTKPLFPQEREDVTALWCSEPLRSKVGGPSKVSPCFAGWDRLNAMFSIPNLKPYLHESAESKD